MINQYSPNHGACAPQAIKHSQENHLNYADQGELAIGIIFA